ncbi:hypothetical protein D1007_06130 [Hordeum vulgare]|nr:hypothetical protein D1007_06130 [Hordeum vulgare]
MGYDPPTRAPTDVVKIYKLFYRENPIKLPDMWIISPNLKYMDISGHQLRDMLREGGDADSVLITLAMRRYQQLDIAFSAAKGEGCWRHFLEPDFVNHVSREDDISKRRYIKDMFVGPHIIYEVNKCTEIVFLVKFDFKWSTYIWDFPRAKIFVLDPTMHNGDESDKDIQQRHRKVADKLHKSIEICIKSFFIGWEPDMRRWNTCFPKGLVTGICKREDTGIYATHLARNWMGTKLKREINPGDGIMHARMNLLVDLLGTENNIGHLPKRYKDCLFPKRDKKNN